MKINPGYVTKSLSIGLCFLTICGPSVAADLPTQLNLVVVDGEGAQGNIGQRVGHLPVVRAEDENHKALAGAAVVFTLPTEGATGQFGNSSKSLTVITDNDGRASAQGLRFNFIPGKVPIHINASYKGLTARTTITEISIAPPGAKIGGGGGGHGKLVAVLIVVAAAAGGGAALALRGKDNTAAAPAGPTVTPIGLTPGTGTVAAGH